MLGENLCQKTYLDMDLYFSHEHIEILANAQGEPIFFRQRDGPYMPTLRLLHKCK